MKHSFFYIGGPMFDLGKKWFSGIAVVAAFYVCPVIANAQDDGVMPPQAAASQQGAPGLDVSDSFDTHPIMRLTPEKSEIVHLDRDASSLIVGNPIHLNVMMDNTKTLVLVPREPGASQFTVLDADGHVIMQRHVIIAGPKQEYVRIRRTCANSQDNNCVDTSMYYCPDMCHETKIMGMNIAVPTLSPSASISSSGSGGIGGDGSGDVGDEGESPAMSAPEMLLNTLQQLLNNGAVPSIEDIPE